MPFEGQQPRLIHCFRNFRGKRAGSGMEPWRSRDTVKTTGLNLDWVLTQKPTENNCISDHICYKGELPAFDVGPRDGRWIEQQPWGAKERRSRAAGEGHPQRFSRIQWMEFHERYSRADVGAKTARHWYRGMILMYELTKSCFHQVMYFLKANQLYSCASLQRRLMELWDWRKKCYVRAFYLTSGMRTIAIFWALVVVV